MHFLIIPEAEVKDKPPASVKKAIYVFDVENCVMYLCLYILFTSRSCQKSKTCSRKERYDIPQTINAILNKMQCFSMCHKLLMLMKLQSLRFPKKRPNRSPQRKVKREGKTSSFEIPKPEL